MPKGKKQKPKLSRTVRIGALAAATLAAGSLIFTSVRHKPPVELPAYTIERVIDGDTMITKEGQRIRLSSVEAPELTRCGGPEAKHALEKLVLGKNVYLKILFTDTYRRAISLAYTPDGFVNEKLIAQGAAQYLPTLPDGTEQMKAASEQAIANKKGIHGPPCTQRINTQHPDCTIKGNRGQGTPMYFPPDCIPYYHQSLVQLYLGDQWFCTEAEAQKAGFTKPETCPQRN